MRSIRLSNDLSPTPKNGLRSKNIQKILPPSTSSLVESSERSETPAIRERRRQDLGDCRSSSAQLLSAPEEKSLKGIRDRAILATLLYHGLGSEELCKLTVADFRHERRGVQYLKVTGKGEETRYVPLHGIAKDPFDEYLQIGPFRWGMVLKR